MLRHRRVVTVGCKLSLLACSNEGMAAGVVAVADTHRERVAKLVSEIQLSLLTRSTEHKPGCLDIAEMISNITHSSTRQRPRRRCRHRRRVANGGAQSADEGDSTLAPRSLDRTCARLSLRHAGVRFNLASRLLQ